MTEYNDILYIVVPCYNEEEVLHETSKRLKEKMTTLINDRKYPTRAVCYSWMTEVKTGRGR